MTSIGTAIQAPTVACHVESEALRSRADDGGPTIHKLAEVEPGNGEALSSAHWSRIVLADYVKDDCQPLSGHCGGSSREWRSRPRVAGLFYMITLPVVRPSSPAPIFYLARDEMRKAQRSKLWSTQVGARWTWPGLALETPSI